MNEKWRDVVGYEGIYQVSDLGRVRSARTTTNTSFGRLLKPYIGRAGYPRVTLRRENVPKLCFVHTLVAHAFLGPQPEGIQVNHKNGDKACSRADNLEYVTQSENMIHAYRVLGAPRSSLRGSDRSDAKLNESAVLQIRQLFATGKYLHKELAQRFGVHSTTISNVLTGKTWKHVGGPTIPTTYQPSRTVDRGFKLSPEQVIQIRALYCAGGISYARLAARFGVHPATIGCVVRGETFPDVG